MHLAEVNIATMLAPLDDPLLAPFVARLAEINALADDAPGFVWRLQTDAGDATALRAYDDDRILFNLSVWRSSDDALGWVPEGHIPWIDEAKDRLERLGGDGPGPEAFTFRQEYTPPWDTPFGS